MKKLLLASLMLGLSATAVSEAIPSSISELVGTTYNKVLESGRSVQMDIVGVHEITLPRDAVSRNPETMVSGNKQHLSDDGRYRTTAYRTNNFNGELELFPDQYTFSDAQRINHRGTVAGHTSYYSFIWHHNGDLVKFNGIGDTEITIKGLNHHDEMVGYDWRNISYRIDKKGNVNLVNGHYENQPVLVGGINDEGTVAGVIRNESMVDIVTTWDNEGKIREVWSGDTWNVVTGINNNNEIIGYENRKPWKWSPNLGLINLEVPLATLSVDFTRDINNAGVTTGILKIDRINDGEPIPVIWLPEGEIVIPSLLLSQSGLIPDGPTIAMTDDNTFYFCVEHGSGTYYTIEVKLHY